MNESFLQGRHTKLAIVLLQKNINTTEDTLAAEHQSILAAKCDINQKMIFVLPYNDNLMGNKHINRGLYVE